MPDAVGGNGSGAGSRRLRRACCWAGHRCSNQQWRGIALVIIPSMVWSRFIFLYQNGFLFMQFR
jgi:hypothetical protein